ncbi:cation-independent mannose-6-phosphate receptor isoform X2 [Orussus abietinus]|uniref:cation-independent mannose-6-phosphate receptor isoform X2 n=1 Tax=Orussus abietinus TaxID=222816 RepID=UPI0006260AC7|nr:cation-independent mannose-6-phosphate receptor isoform X2 [Orussus abietinus]
MEVSRLVFTLFLILSTVTCQKRTDEYCSWRNEDINYQFNFKNLSLEDLIINDDAKDLIHLRLCSPLETDCNGQYGYSICLSKNNTKIGLGKAPPEVNVTKGIKFKFFGDRCNANTNYTVQIIMQCNSSAVHETVPHMFQKSENHCEWYMIWYTKAACGNIIKSNCTAKDDSGRSFNLSPLTRISDNYIIDVGNTSSKKIILNICHSLIFGDNTKCHPNSGACLQKSKTNNDTWYENLGNVDSSSVPVFKDGQLQLQYFDEKTLDNTYITLYFVCDPSANNTDPAYMNESGPFHYKLSWRTNAACVPDLCTATNPVTNFQHNLQTLMSRAFTIKALNGSEYKIAICRPLLGNPCKSGTGVCFSKNGTSFGQSNTNLTWQKKGPFLNYTNGDICNNHGQRRYTLISFFCGSESSYNGPRIIKEDKCSLIIHWDTSLVCEKSIKCSTENNEVNLTSLIRIDHNYVVKSKDVDFYINICRPLLPMNNVNCPQGAAICQARRNPTGQLINFTSLGFPNEPPHLGSDGQPLLRYQSNVLCPENPKKLISTNITFLRSPYTETKIEYKDYGDCTYKFDVRTSVVSEVPTTSIEPCTLEIPLTSDKFFLFPLPNESVHYVKGRNGKLYEVSICGSRHCNGSVVCEGNNGYGSKTDVLFDHRRNVVTLKYSNGTKCTNNSYDSLNSEIKLKCNMTAGVNAPQIKSETDCRVEFEWQTSVVCSNLTTRETITIASDPIDPTNEVQGGSSIAGPIAILVLVILIACFCLYSPARRARLRSYLKCCNSDTPSGRAQYYRVSTNEESCSLLDSSDPTHCQSDSDEDLLCA